MPPHQAKNSKVFKAYVFLERLFNSLGRLSVTVAVVTSRAHNPCCSFTNIDKCVSPHLCRYWDQDVWILGVHDDYFK